MFTPPVFLLTPSPPQGSPLFPYTTLFRSRRHRVRRPGSPLRQGTALRPGLRPTARRRRRRWGLERLQLAPRGRSEEHTSELQSHSDLVCRLLLEKKKFLSREPSNKSMIPE